MAGEFSLHSAEDLQIIAVVPTSSGNLVYTGASYGAAGLDSDVGAPGVVTSVSTKLASTNGFLGGVAYTVSSGFGAAAANGAWGAAFASGFAYSAAGFAGNGTGATVVTNSGSASGSVAGLDPVDAAARYDSRAEVTYSVNGIPAVTLSSTLGYTGTLSVPANANPTIAGFELIPGTPGGIYRLRPPVSPFVASATAVTPAIHADISSPGSILLDLGSGAAPVTASSGFDGRAALGAVAVSTNGGLETRIDLDGPALSLTSSASNSSALMSVGSALAKAVSTIDLSTDDAELATTGNASHAIIAGLASQQQSATLPVLLAGDNMSVRTSGANSWGVVAFGSSGLDIGSVSTELSGSGSSIATSGQASGGAMLSANGGAEASAGLMLSGAGSTIATSNDASVGASIIATSPLKGKATVVLSGARSAIGTGGVGSAALLVSAHGERADASIELSGLQSALSTRAQGSSGALSVAHGTERAGINVGLSGNGSNIQTIGDGASGTIVAAFANSARVNLDMSGQGAWIETQGDTSAGFAGTAIGTNEAVAEARLSGLMARIRTMGDNSAGISLTSIATGPDALSRIGLDLSDSGSAIETLGSNSSAVTLSGAAARLVVGKGARVSTGGATSHGALFSAGAAEVEIKAGGLVATRQADSAGLFFMRADSANSVRNSGSVLTAGSAIVSAGQLRLRNHGSTASSADTGVDLASGWIWNDGMIAGETAIARGASGTGAVVIENRGRILSNDGPGHVAIALSGNFDDQLSLGPDGIIVGTVELGGGIDRFTALPGANLDFWFETAPEEVVAGTGVLLPRPDGRNVIIVDPGYLAGTAASSGLAAAGLAAGGIPGAPVEIAQGDCGGTVISGRGGGVYSDFRGHDDRAPATTASYGVVTDYLPDDCSDGAVSGFIGVNQMVINGGGDTRSRTASVFAGGRYSGQNPDGFDYEFLGGIGYLSGTSRRHVLNNRVASGVEVAEADYSSWMAFAGFRLARQVSIDQVELTPFLQARVALGGGYGAQEAGILNPVYFNVGNSFGYDASAGLTLAMGPEIFEGGIAQVFFSGAVVIAGNNTGASISLSDGVSASYARNHYDMGVRFGGGFDLTFEARPVRLRFDAATTAWNYNQFSVAFNSSFKYSF